MACGWWQGLLFLDKLLSFRNCFCFLMNPLDGISADHFLFFCRPRPNPNLFQPHIKHGTSESETLAFAEDTNLEARLEHSRKVEAHATHEHPEHAGKDKKKMNIVVPGIIRFHNARMRERRLLQERDPEHCETKWSCLHVDKKADGRPASGQFQR